MVTDVAQLATLSPQECLRRLHLRTPHLGRVGVNDPDGHPRILPVNYRVDRDAIVIRTEPESLLARQAIGHVVAFEVDEVDPPWLEGWSVLIQGTSRQVTDAEELNRLRRLPLPAGTVTGSARTLRS